MDSVYEAWTDANLRGLLNVKCFKESTEKTKAGA